MRSCCLIRLNVNCPDFLTHPTIRLSERLLQSDLRQVPLKIIFQPADDSLC